MPPRSDSHVARCSCCSEPLVSCCSSPASTSRACSSRAPRRAKREIAIRKALGATRGRLTQQFLAEALLLLTAGSALGLVAARWGTRALVALAPGDFYSSFDVSIDARVLAVTGGLTVLTALVFSILPGFAAVRPTPSSRCATEGGRLRQIARANRVGACSS